MSRSRAFLTVLALLAVTALAACGSDDSGGTSTADKAAATSSTQAAPAPSTTSEPAATTTAKETDATVAKCHNTYDAYIAKLIKVEADADDTPRYSSFATTMAQLVSSFQAANPQSDSKGCQDAVGRFAGASFLQFAGATETWSKCPTRSKCSAYDRDFIKARLGMGRSNLALARHGYSTMPKS